MVLMNLNVDLAPKVDLGHADAELSGVILGMLNSPRKDSHVGHHATSSITSSFVMEEIGRPKLWRMVAITNLHEEAIFTVQGYIVKSLLPPVTYRDNLPKRPLYIQQGVTISGFGSYEFERSVEGLRRLYLAAATMLPENHAVRSWRPDEFYGYPCLNFVNRYFTAVAHAKGEGLPAFGKGVDPHDRLLEFVASPKHGVVHIEENEVQYYKRVGHTRPEAFSQQRFIRIEPRMIRIGDLVELKVSIVAFPGSRSKPGILKPVLRSIAVLSTSLREKAMMSDSGLYSTSRKRTYGYVDADEEGLELTTTKFSRISTDDNDHVSDDE